MTAAQKAERYAYQKLRRQKITQAARDAGVIGGPRPRKYETDAERKAARKAYSKAYRSRITAEAKAYREMMAGKHRR